MVLLNVTTDWIQAIGTIIGFPAALWGIVVLFKKDKEKQKQINALIDIANQLTQNVEQMTLQSQELHYQSTLMLDANKLVEKQIEMATNSFLHNQTVEENKIEFEKQKRLNEIKPHFILGGSSKCGNDFSIYLTNKGSVAKNIKMEVLKNENIHFRNSNWKSRIEKDEDVKIEGKLDKNIHSFEIDFFYEDIDNNTYYQKMIDFKHIDDPVFCGNKKVTI
jgi:hypothetical protein